MRLSPRLARPLRQLRPRSLPPPPLTSPVPILNASHGETLHHSRLRSHIRARSGPSRKRGQRPHGHPVSTTCYPLTVRGLLPRQCASACLITCCLVMMLRVCCIFMVPSAVLIRSRATEAQAQRSCRAFSLSYVPLSSSLFLPPPPPRFFRPSPPPFSLSLTHTHTHLMLPGLRWAICARCFDPDLIAMPAALNPACMVPGTTGRHGSAVLVSAASNHVACLQVCPRDVVSPPSVLKAPTVLNPPTPNSALLLSGLSG